MQVIIKARPRRAHLTPALRAYAADKLARHAERLLEVPAASMDIVLSRASLRRGGGCQSCRVVVQVARRRPVIISEQADDMYQAIDRSHRRLSMALKRDRRRLLDAAAAAAATA